MEKQTTNNLSYAMKNEPLKHPKPQHSIKEETESLKKTQERFIL